MPAPNAYNAGDVISRTVGGTMESVVLPPISLSHLQTIVVRGGKVSGFHVLPSSVASVSSVNEMTLPPGAVQLLDVTGSSIAGAQIKLTPLRLPASANDAFEARVEVVDSAGRQVAFDPSKSFFPQGWTAAQVQQAIYSAYTQHYLAGGAAFFVRMRLTTPQGVKIWMRVAGNQSAAGTVLTEVSTAYLDQGQNLAASHAP